MSTNHVAYVAVEPLDQGGTEVTLTVPTYNGGVDFTLRAERDENGDWRVFMPWPDSEDEEPVTLPNGIEVANGIAYLGAPDDEPTEPWEFDENSFERSVAVPCEVEGCCYTRGHIERGMPHRIIRNAKATVTDLFCPECGGARGYHSSGCSENPIPHNPTEGA